MPLRILAIDFGTARLGLAVSDPQGVVALGLPTLERRNLEHDLSWIRALITEYDVGEVVLGRPLSAKGKESSMSRRVAHFAEKLRRRVKCQVRLWDERLTSAQASRLLRDSGMGVMKRRRAVDRVAATLILQSYLDWRTQEACPNSSAGAKA